MDQIHLHFTCYAIVLFFFFLAFTCKNPVLRTHSILLLDLPTIELKFFHEREAQADDFLCFLRQKRARERELDLFPLQKIASSDVILAPTICVPVACVVA